MRDNSFGCSPLAPLHRRLVTTLVNQTRHCNTRARCLRHRHLAAFIQVLSESSGALPTRRSMDFPPCASYLLHRFQLFQKMSSRPEDRFTFELSGDRGAALVTTHDTRRKDCVDGSVLDKHISNNYQSWTRFAHDTAQLPRDAQLILVSGFDVTRDFSMVSYLHRPRRYPFPIGIPARRQMFFSTWSHFRGGWSYTRQPYFNGGTSHRFNQCVFIRYFTMRHRSFFSQVAQFLRARFGSMGNGGKSVPGPAPKPDDRPTTGDEGNPGGQFYSTTGGADTEKTTAAQTTSYVWSLPPPFLLANCLQEKDPDDWDVIADYVFRVTPSPTSRYIN